MAQTIAPLVSAQQDARRAYACLIGIEATNAEIVEAMVVSATAFANAQTNAKEKYLLASQIFLILDGCHSTETQALELRRWLEDKGIL